MGRRLRWLLLLLITASVPARGDDSDPSRVTYLSGATAYVNVGRADGVAAGAWLEIRRGGVVIDTLEVISAATHQASCRPIDGLSAQVGDRVRVLRSETSAVTSPAPAERFEPGVEPLPATREPVRKGRGWARQAGVQGSVQLRLAAVDHGAAGGNYARPSIDLRFNGVDVFDSGVGLDARVQTRRTVATGSKSEVRAESESRVYRASASWRAGEIGPMVSVGRQASADLSRVSLFDGVLVQSLHPRWAAGLFTGTQPDPSDFGYDATVREHGGFVRANLAGAQADRRMSLTLGAVGSYHLGTIDREYAFLQWRGEGERLSTDLFQQLDFNRGWRRRTGKTAWTASNTYAFARVRLSDQLSIEGAFDGRQEVRVYRFKETPETEFDDTYRRGVWAGFTQRIGRRFQFGARGRVSSAGSAEQLQTVTMTSSASWPALASLRARWRSTEYDNAWTRGWMHSINVGWAIGDRFSADLTQGWRFEKSSGAADKIRYWSEGNVDLDLGRHWSATGSAENSYGADPGVWTYFSGLRYRL